MADPYSVEACRRLARVVADAELHRPMRVERYETGDELAYEVTGVVPAVASRVRLTVEKFVGGGFAGQVYRVRLLEMGAPLPGLAVGGLYALKILLPPSPFSRKVRDSLYAVAFQAPFQQQVNPAAARAGALWQKFIRRAAAEEFGDDRAVVDIYATLVDTTIGGCGELREWVEGRVWQFEVDDHLGLRKRWSRGLPVPQELLGSPEYRAKRRFMARFVALMHRMGAPELARQYEWWTCKSQPNVLKRFDAEGPAEGLTAVDFRAGLALLPFLPMSPGDVRLIAAGIARGSLVQFDRGDLRTLQRFVEDRREPFADMAGAMEELKDCERIYRDSQPDITHNHVRLLTSGRLWRTMLDSAVAGWRVTGKADAACASSLHASRFLTLTFALFGLVPRLSRLAGLAVLVAGWVAGVLWPFRLTLEPRGSVAPPPQWPLWLAAAALLFIAPRAARLLRRLWGRGDYRRHYAAVFAESGYLRRALRGDIAETLIRWHRAGRVSADRAERLAERPWRLLGHAMLSPLPAGLHRFVTDGAFARDKLSYVFVRPVRLFFNAEAREQWLRDMLAEGRRKGMLSPEDAATIERRIKEPFIQKYLKALAVHVCTLPVTQLVSVTLAAIHIAVNYGARPLGELFVEGAGIVGLFQVTPISPGSLTRGLYVVYLVIRERNIRDYNIAVWLGFFKYVGYLAFPIQMAYRYPALARFMAGHWATGAVHVVPVFGEHGALLEHGVFDLFYNRPLTIRRRMARRAELRKGLRPRSWHAGAIALLAAGAWAAVDWLCLARYGAPPTLRNVWWLAIVLPFAAGLAAAAWGRGATTAARIKLAALCGTLVGLLYGAFHVYTHVAAGIDLATLSEKPGARGWNAAALIVWRVFAFTLAAMLGAIAAETLAGEPNDDGDLERA